MNPDLLAWGSVLIAAASLAYTYVSNRNKAGNEKIAKVDAEVEKVERWCGSLTDRVVKVESAIAHLPDKESTHKLEMGLMELKIEVRAVSEQLKPVSAISNRMQEYLLELAERRP